MFENIKNFFGRMRGNMLDKSVISRAAATDIALSDSMCAARNLWRDMYTDNDGLHLPAAIAFEMARLMTVEFGSCISGSNRADFLNESYQQVMKDIRIPLEYGCAKGGLVFKPYVSGGKILVDFIQADRFFPTAFDHNGRICGAVFVQSHTADDRFYTRLEKHTLSGNTYTITNSVYCSRSRDSLGSPVGFSEVPEWKDLSESVTIGNVRQPLFGYFRPAIANCIEPGSPVGVSVYANAVNLIHDADEQYKRLMWEFESGQRALIANAMAFRRDRDGKPRLPDRRLYRTLDVEDMDFFKEWSPQLRESEISNGLNRILRQIEFNCGLAYGTLSDVSNQDKTAEEIRTSKQRSYATVCDNQKALKIALQELVYAMDVWCTLYGLAPRGRYSLSFDFDDSVLADRRAQFDERRQLVESGIMQPYEFRMWYFGEDEEQARKKIQVV